jgi:hypothetical protein
LWQIVLGHVILISMLDVLSDDNYVELSIYVLSVMLLVLKCFLVTFLISIVFVNWITFDVAS